LPAASRIASLKSRARQANIPAIYVNDNFGKWQSDFKKLVSHVLDDDTRGERIAELLRPQAEDYFVLKPKQSGFYFTSLDLLLKHLGAEDTDPNRLDGRHLYSFLRPSMHTCVTIIS